MPTSFERLNELTACLASVTELIRPKPDCHELSRYEVCVLLDFLTQEYQTALKQLS